MARASISHIALTVSDLNRSAEFYDRIFKFMGYMPVLVPDTTQQAMKTQLKAWSDQATQYRSGHRRVTLRTGCMIETLLASTIWRFTLRTGRISTRCTTS